jgi:hypothetical protein
VNEATYELPSAFRNSELVATTLGSVLSALLRSSMLEWCAFAD